MINYNANISTSRGDPKFYGTTVDSYAQRPFLPELPSDIMKSGQFSNIAVMMGTTKDGAVFQVKIAVNRGHI